MVCFQGFQARDVQKACHIGSAVGKEDVDKGLQPSKLYTCLEIRKEKWVSDLNRLRLGVGPGDTSEVFGQ